MYQAVVIFILALQDQGAWREAKIGLDKVRSSPDTPPVERAAAVKAAANARFPEVDREAAESVYAVLEAEIARRGDERNVSADVLDACLDVFRKLNHEEATKFLIKKAKEGPNWRVRYYVILGLANHPGGAVTPALMELVYNGKKPQSEPHLATASVDALAERKDPIALDIFHRALIEKDFPWEARLGALRGIARLGDKSSIDVLIDALKVIPNEQGRLKSTLIEVLQQMTGLSLATGDWEAWKSAWSGKATEAKGKGGGTQVSAPVRPVDFFGLKSKSTKIVFVLDLSGSMTQKASDLPEPKNPKNAPPAKPPEGPEISSGGGKTGAKPVKNPDPLDPARDLDSNEQAAMQQAKSIYDSWMAKSCTTRIELLKKQVIKTLYGLDHRVWFGMVYYSTDVKDWKNQLIAGTWVNKVEAMRSIEGLQAAGATNTGDALLDHALKMVSTPTPKGKYDGPPVAQPGGNHVEVISGPDTIYLLTDGEPNAGRYAAGGAPADLATHTKNAIMNELRKIVALRKVTIHTICIGDPGAGPNAMDAVDPTWLKSIADLTGGSFVHVSGRGR
jgi:uncharacterized spore protein YtfJ